MTAQSFDTPAAASVNNDIDDDGLAPVRVHVGTEMDSLALRPPWLAYGQRGRRCRQVDIGMGHKNGHQDGQEENIMPPLQAMVHVVCRKLYNVQYCVVYNLIIQLSSNS